jgi:hypothetical protein
MEREREEHGKHMRDSLSNERKGAITDASKQIYRNSSQTKRHDEDKSFADLILKFSLW